MYKFEHTTLYRSCKIWMILGLLQGYLALNLTQASIKTVGESGNSAGISSGSATQGKVDFTDLFQEEQDISSYLNEEEIALLGNYIDNTTPFQFFSSLLQASGDSHPNVRESALVVLRKLFAKHPSWSNASTLQMIENTFLSASSQTVAGSVFDLLHLFLEVNPALNHEVALLTFKVVRNYAPQDQVDSQSVIALVKDIVSLSPEEIKVVLLMAQEEAYDLHGPEKVRAEVLRILHAICGLEVFYSNNAYLAQLFQIILQCAQETSSYVSNEVVLLLSTITQIVPEYARQTFEAVVQSTKSEDPATRNSGLEILKFFVKADNIYVQEAFEVALTATQDPQGMVRWNAMTVLATVVKAEPKYVPDVAEVALKAAEAPDFAVSITALRLLRALVKLDDTHMDQILAVAVKTIEYPNQEVQVEALKLLSTLVDTHAKCAVKAFPVGSQSLQHTDEQIRWNGVLLLRSIVKADPVTYAQKTFDIVVKVVGDKVLTIVQDGLSVIQTIVESQRQYAPQALSLAIRLTKDDRAEVRLYALQLVAVLLKSEPKIIDKVYTSLVAVIQDTAVEVRKQAWFTLQEVLKLDVRYAQRKEVRRLIKEAGLDTDAGVPILVGLQKTNKDLLSDEVLLSALLITYTHFFDKRPTAIQTSTSSFAPMSAPVQPENALPSASSSLSGTSAGRWSKGIQGQAKEVVLENKDIRVTLTTQGATIQQVILKHHKDHQGNPLQLVDAQSSKMEFQFTSHQTPIHTHQLCFYTTDTDQYVQGEVPGKVTFTFQMGTTDQYIQQTFTLPSEGYALTHQWAFVGAKNYVDPASLGFVWHDHIKRVEQDIQACRNKTTMNYCLADQSFKHFKEQATEKEEKMVQEPIQWLAMKQRFFTAGVFSEQPFTSGKLTLQPATHPEEAVKEAYAQLHLPADQEQPNQQGTFRLYFGPNVYKELHVFAKGFSQNLSLGWPVVKWINLYLIMPTFSFIEKYVSNYGLVIFFLPTLDALKVKYGHDVQAMQMEQVKLYKEMGINPLSGCIPVLLQMPILLAMFNFFPNAIDLRQKSFLWATDLSTYDAIVHLPFTIPFYGSHVSLFTLLMTASTLLYTRSSNQVNAPEGPMKVMSYMLPITFMFILNSFPAGLSFYYFVSNLFTYAQQEVIKRFADEDKIKIKLANKRKSEGKDNPFKKRFQDAIKATAKKKIQPVQASSVGYYNHREWLGNDYSRDFEVEALNRLLLDTNSPDGNVAPHMAQWQAIYVLLNYKVTKRGIPWIDRSKQDPMARLKDNRPSAKTYSSVKHNIDLPSFSMLTTTANQQNLSYKDMQVSP
eukprot:gene31-44_t